LIAPAQHLAERECGAGLLSIRIPLGQHRRQIGAVDVLHHQELAGPIGEVVDHARQGRVTQAGQQPRLAFERAADLIAGQHHLLQGYGVAEPQVGRLVDRAHAALADMTYDAVAILQERVGLEHHAVPR
jgi:hypothetical protein